MQTFKKDLIVQFANMVQNDEDISSIVFVTPSGLISGTPINSNIPFEELEDSDYIGAISNLNKKFYNEYKSEYSIPENESLNDNDGVILLKDVIIKSGNTSFSLPFLELFFDQIIGISLGKFN